ncbi:CASP2 [Bugula neritina]|uniref:CASP2 n=1 Tax=Bugula neritina TaxID=10212 RepID=A0A7J7KAE5_BUGNE|nr:CASP2 [Bugula neritina]
MISMLFHHSSKSKWEQRLQTFRTFKFENQIIEKQTYEQFIKSFTESGLLNKVLLIHLLKTETETKFPHKAAIEVLKSFCIIHGPVTQEYGKGYFVPYFAQEFTNENSFPPNDVQLKMEILFNGLHLPKYVHQLITVEVLNFISDETCLIKIYGNGTFVAKGEQSLHLVHDYNNRKLMILVSSPIELIGSSWSLLTSLIAHILNKLANVWRAIRPVITFYCSHCLLIRSPTPDTKVNPPWLFAAPKESHLNNRFFVSVKSFRGVEPVYCNNGMQPGTSKQTVPKPFKFPCFEFSECEMSKLKDYTEKLQRKDFFKTSGPQAINYPVENEDSEVSDVEQQGYFGTESNACIKMELKPCTKDSVTRLFSNTTKVYPMKTEVKGRVLILDNRLFQKKPGYARKGGEIDYVNIRRLFEKMSFEIATDEEDTTDLTSEEMFQAIKDETALEVHKHLSMFVLIIMSHGQTGDQILSHDNKWVKLGDIKHLLSASQFTAMKGKPKLIIIQACSGNRIDYGDTKNSSNDPINVQGAGSHTSLEENIASQDDQNSFLTSQLSQEQFDAESSYSENAEAAIPPRSLPNFEDIHLDSDDFFVMKASSDDTKQSKKI